MKNGSMATCFIWHNMAFLVMVEKPYKGHHYTTLRDGILPNLNIFTRKGIGKANRSVQAYTH